MYIRSLIPHMFFFVVVVPYLTSVACSSCDQWCSTESVWHHWKLHLPWSLWGKSLSADISLNLCIHSCDTCQNSYRNVTMEWKSGVSYWMTSHILMEKNEVSQQGVVIEWNTLNNGQDPSSWNQSAPSLRPRDHWKWLHASLCDYALVSRHVQRGHAWWMTSTDFSVINFKKSLQTICWTVLQSESGNLLFFNKEIETGIKLKGIKDQLLFPLFFRQINR